MPQTDRELLPLLRALPFGFSFSLDALSVFDIWIFDATQFYVRDMDGPVLPRALLLIAAFRVLL